MALNWKTIAAVIAASGVSGYIGMILADRHNMKEHRKHYNQRYDVLKGLPDEYRILMNDSNSIYLVGGIDATGHSRGIVLFYDAQHIDETISVIDRLDLTKETPDDLYRLMQAVTLSNIPI